VVGGEEEEVKTSLDGSKLKSVTGKDVKIITWYLPTTRMYPKRVTSTFF
jgi:hypothetical protein